jgi:TPR repeat protein
MKRYTAAVLFTCLLSIGASHVAWANYSLGNEAYLLKNYAKAMKEFKADEDPRSLYQLGFMYDHGEGVTQDGKQAAEWYRKAAEKGNIQAQYRLGVLYANGYGVEQDLKEAAKWYKKAAAQGFPPARDALKKLPVAP